MVGGLVGGVVGVALVAWLFRLGWEWGLACVAVVVAMPTLLDLAGPARLADPGVGARRPRRW